MIKSVLPPSALLLCSAFAFAAGGGVGVGAGGAAGAAIGSHASSTSHGGSGNTAIENNTSPRGLALASRRGGRSAFCWIALAKGTAIRDKSLANERISCRGDQSGHPSHDPEDQLIIDEVKQANERLGAVGNPATGRTENRQTHRPTDVSRTNEDVQRRNTDRSRPLTASAPSDSSAAGERTDPRSVESKPNVSQMSEESQRLAREVLRDTDKLGKIGNPGAGGASQAQQGSLAGAGSDLPSDANGPHLPPSTMAARRGAY
jgi:hypothetical protein